MMMLAPAALLVAGLLAQANQQPRDTRTPQSDETVSVTRGARLSINNFTGEVQIRTWDRDQVRVQARYSSRGKVNIRQTPTVVTISAETHAIGSVDYEITAPTWMPLKIEGTYNYVMVEGSQADVSAESVRGDIVIKGGNGVIVAKSIQGEVIIEGARGRINVSSVNEGVRVTGAQADIVAETTNGHISLTKIAASNVEVSTVNGNIVYEGTVADKGRYRFTTHNGNITVGVPENSNVTFNVRTYNGDFASNLNVSGPPRSEVRRGRRIAYTLGNGSAEMEMETFAGTIRLRRPN